MDWIGQAVLDGLTTAAFTVWNWLLEWTIGFIPNYVLVVILVVIALAAYLKFGFKGLIALAIAIFAAMELQRRTQVKGHSPKDDPQWPDVVPKPKKPRGKRKYNFETNLWE